MTLLQAKKGRSVRIIEIPDDRARAQCVRFGIGEGTIVDSTETLMAGPVLVRHRNQEICVGRKLASSILVEIDPEGASGRGRSEDEASGVARGHRLRWRAHHSRSV
ncbi:MAG TPA: ferrous iron transport protein A [Thermoleophilia bacterium]|nr:ferrous iron transport protein A [Thermoleophilia bacterium]